MCYFTLTMSSPAYVKYTLKSSIGSSHSWAISKCASLSPEARVLDIGPGSGVMGRKLRENGIKKIDAVEIEAETREHLKDIYNRIEERVDPLFGQKYDLILLLDVLEHITDPEAFVEKIKPLLTPEGRFLISVPNVAHLTMRISLLFGFFEYTSRGILDATHLTFFTRRTFRSMLKTCNLEIIELNSTIPPLELLVPKWFSRSTLFALLAKFHLALARALPRLLSYQHLAECKLRGAVK